MDDTGFMMLNLLIKRVEQIGYTNLDKGTKDFIDDIYLNYDKLKEIHGDKFQPLYDFVKSVYENNRGNNAN